MKKSLLLIFVLLVSFIFFTGCEKNDNSSNISNEDVSNELTTTVPVLDDSEEGTAPSDTVASDNDTSVTTTVATTIKSTTVATTKNVTTQTSKPKDNSVSTTNVTTTKKVDTTTVSTTAKTTVATTTSKTTVATTKACTSKKFSHKYSYVYDTADECKHKGNDAFFYVVDNVDTSVFVYSCEQITDECGKSYYGVYFMSYSPEKGEYKFYY